MSNNNKSSGGIGFLGLLAIVFITLKLCKVIDWSWWWVTCPLWGLAAVYGIGAGITYLLAAITVSFFSTPKQKEQMKKIMEEQKKNAGKSQWQMRLDAMQEAQKKAAELKKQRGY